MSPCLGKASRATIAMRLVNRETRGMGEDLEKRATFAKQETTENRETTEMPGTQESHATPGSPTPLAPSAPLVNLLAPNGAAPITTTTVTLLPGSPVAFLIKTGGLELRSPHAGLSRLLTGNPAPPENLHEMLQEIYLGII